VPIEGQLNIDDFALELAKVWGSKIY